MCRYCEGGKRFRDHDVIEDRQVTRLSHHHGKGCVNAAESGGTDRVVAAGMDTF